MGNQTTLVRTPDEERVEVCGEESGKDGSGTKKKRKTKTKIERLCME